MHNIWSAATGWSVSASVFPKGPHSPVTEHDPYEQLPLPGDAIENKSTAVVNSVAAQACIPKDTASPAGTVSCMNDNSVQRDQGAHRVQAGLYKRYRYQFALTYNL